MNEKTISIKNIKPNNWNPNEMTQEQFAELVREVRHLGKPPKPIVLRIKGDGYEIVDGEHSYRALKELGIEVLQEGWFEIVDYDELEAKRQTWKRNLGGTNNPVKAGLMFEKAKEESGLSNRQLAEKMELSEATIRAYLFYAEAGKVRGDHAALARLTNEQIRIFVKLSESSKHIANFWLYEGGLEDALIWYSDEKYKEAKTRGGDIIVALQKSFEEIVKQGFDETLRYKDDSIPFNLSQKEQEAHIQNFKIGIRRAKTIPQLLPRMEANFNLSKDTNIEQLLEYLHFGFNEHLYSNAPQAFRKIILSTSIRKVNNKLEFMLTPNELKGSIEAGDENNFKPMLDKAKQIVAKKYQMPLFDVKRQDDTLEDKLDGLELERNRVPEYIRQTYTPIKLKRIFSELQFESEEIKRKNWEIVSKCYRTVKLRELDMVDEQIAKEKIKNLISETDKEEKKKKEIATLTEKSEQELAELFVRNLRPLTKGDENFEKELMPKLVNNFSKEYLHLFVWLSNKYYNEMKWKEYVNAITKEVLGRKRK